MDNAAFFAVEGAQKAFGSVPVLGGVDLSIARGQFVSLLGPSGCGKTTLLRIIAGLTTPDSGQVRLDGEDITRRAAHRRDVGVVFQNYALFPHLTVAENVAFGLKAKGVDSSGIPGRVRRFLDLVHMSAFSDRSVRGLSGGQQQRVAVARALVVEPKLLLLDEPFSALDRKLRESMQIELRRLLRELGTTAILVTHDQDEALVMSDYVAVMNRGSIDQFADPVSVYRRPASAFALGFVGLSTRLNGKVTASSAEEITVDTFAGPIRAPAKFRIGSPVIVGVRPEAISVGPAGSGNSVQAKLTDTVFQGSKVQLLFDAPPSQQIIVESTRLPEGATQGMVMQLTWAVDDTLVYPDEAT